ncbi:MAG: hypothetical protein K1X67_00270 [Fimbriimonadaceae bacterium]|nr:hypothetical protein [Fimbriimonadaceae bacterium]
MAITAIDETALCDLVLNAQARVAYAAPSLDMALASALSEAVTGLGVDRVSVVLDLDPEVFRLGYGSFEAVEFLRASCVSEGLLICSEPGLRIGLLVADDDVIAFAPIPKLVADEGTRSVNGVTLKVGQDPHEILDDLGAGRSGRLIQTVGMEGISQTEIDAVRQDLAGNPPLRFEVARQVRVFNAQFEFVEWEVSGCKLSRKKVTLPSDFFAIIEDEDSRKRLKPDYELIGDERPLKSAEKALDEHRQQIEKKYLHTLAGYGKIVLRRDRDELDTALKTFDLHLDQYRDEVRAALQESIDRSVAGLARSLGAELERKPPDELLRQRKWQPDLGATDFLTEKLTKIFGSVDQHVREMKSRVIFRGVTYESLQDEDFLEKAQRLFPNLKGVFDEYVAAQGPDARQLEL